MKIAETILNVILDELEERDLICDEYDELEKEETKDILIEIINDNTWMWRRRAMIDVEEAVNHIEEYINSNNFNREETAQILSQLIMRLLIWFLQCF